MLAQLTTRPALAATVSAAAIAAVVVAWPALRTGAPVAPLPSVPATQPVPEAREMAPATVATPEPAAPREEAAGAARVTTLAEAETPAAEIAPQQDAAAITTAEADAPSIAAAPPVAPMAEKAAPLGRTRTVGIVADNFVAAPEVRPIAPPDTEAFANADTNPIKIAGEEPVSTFSIDADTASWSVLRSSLTAGTLPPREAVRVEEMVNYFPYAYPAPEPGEAPFRASVSLFQTPWNPDTELLRIGLQGAMPGADARPPLNLVFLIDTSGSMEDANKLPLLRQSFRLMLGQLQPEDRVAIVTYAGSAGLVLEPTAASDKTAILSALDRLSAGGSTAGQEGLQQAYKVAEGMGGDGHVSRILLATDGDFNVGLSDPEALKDFVAKKRETGTYLSVLGFGRGNLDDATMQALAQNGNGRAAYIDTLAEAQKVLVDQLTGALFPIADDVKIQIEFNPAMVAEYRLIGYETRALAREDFNNDKVDAGEIGAGHQVTALYEITPVGSPARLSDPLRYAAPAKVQGGAGELGFLKLRYKAPGAQASHLIETPIPAVPGEADTDARFAAAIAGMGQLLSEPKYLGGWGWDDAIALANGARGEDAFGYRAEAVQLMRLAQSLSQ